MVHDRNCFEVCIRAYKLYRIVQHREHVKIVYVELGIFRRRKVHIMRDKLVGHGVVCRDLELIFRVNEVHNLAVHIHRHGLELNFERRRKKRGVAVEIVDLAALRTLGLFCVGLFREKCVCEIPLDKIAINEYLGDFPLVRIVVPFTQHEHLVYSKCHYLTLAIVLPTFLPSSSTISRNFLPLTCRIIGWRLSRLLLL